MDQVNHVKNDSSVEISSKSEMPSKCGFCKQAKEEVCSGEMLFSQDGQVIVHRRCLLFSTVPVAYKISKNENLCPISVRAIKKELWKAAKAKCSHCRQSGAAVKCGVTICRKVYHYPCVKADNGAIIENEIHGIYRICCHKHKTEQKLVEGSSFENIEDAQEPAQRKKEELEAEEEPRPCSQKVDPQIHSSCSQTKIHMNCEVKNCSNTCLLGYATSGSIKVVKNIDKDIDSRSGYVEEESYKDVLRSTSSRSCTDSGEEESCSYWDDELKQKMRDKIKDDGRLKKSQKQYSYLSDDRGTLQDFKMSKATSQKLGSLSCNSRLKTEKIKENTVELLQHRLQCASDPITTANGPRPSTGRLESPVQSKETPTKVPESNEIAACMDSLNLEKAKLFWNKMQSSGCVEHIFEQLNNVLNFLKKKIANGSANNQVFSFCRIFEGFKFGEQSWNLQEFDFTRHSRYLKNESITSKEHFSPFKPIENEERFQFDCEEISEKMISEEIESESASDNSLFFHTSVIKRLAPSTTCTSPTKEFNHANCPDRFVFQQHKCSRMCIAGVMPPTSDHFKGENPLKIPILCQFQRRHAKLHWDTEVMEPPHVSYKAPCGRSLRNFKEVRDYLFQTQCDFLSLDFFSFNTYIQLSRTFPCKNPIVYKADISHGIEPTPIPLHNAIDTSTPEHFKYRKVRLPHGYLITNSAEMFQGKCSCTNGCTNKSRCACQQLTAKVNKRFSKAAGYECKRLLQCAPSGVYECNTWCKCNKRSCENRVVQQGLRIRLQLFKTHKKGWGVRCMDDIDKGTFVCCYAGRILSITNEMERRINDKILHFNDTDLRSNKTAMSFIKREKKESDLKPEQEPSEEMEETKAILKEEETTPFVKASPSITQKGRTELTSRRKTRVRKFDLHYSELTSVERPKTKTAVIQTRRRKLREQGQILVMPSSSEEDESESLSEQHKRLPRSSSPKCKILSDNQLINSDKGVLENRNSIDYGKSHSVPFSGNIFESSLLSQQIQQEAEKQENKTDNENINRENKLVQGNDCKEQVPKLQRFWEGDDLTDGYYFLDATEEGNIGRFLNHSCDPNLMVQSVFVDTHNKNFPWVAFFANRHIKAGSELTWDYSYSEGTIPEEEIPCFCGSIKCRNA
ncbi:histone-lysine N-methyltransferase SETDB2-like isoform X3 [Narcine bancroftii]